MDLKMVVTDLDGSMLRDDKTLSNYTIDILNTCRENGILLAFATARGGNSQIPIEMFDGFVRSNGAVAFARGKRVYSKTIPVQSARRVLTAADNAVDEVKKMADYICDTNENDGVAKWIQEYVLNTH